MVVTAISDAGVGAISALGGVAVTGLIGLATAALNHRWQEGTRNRERADRLQESRASLRRDAYTRFLIATDTVSDYCLTRPPARDGELEDLSKIFERLRALRSSGDTQFTEYSASQLQVKLLAGPAVARTLEEFATWMDEQFALAVSRTDPMGSGVFGDLEDRRRPLIEAMRDEQEEDLVAEA